MSSERPLECDLANAKNLINQDMATIRNNESPKNLDAIIKSQDIELIQLKNKVDKLQSENDRLRKVESELQDLEVEFAAVEEQNNKSRDILLTMNHYLAACMTQMNQICDRYSNPQKRNATDDLDNGADKKQRQDA